MKVQKLIEILMDLPLDAEIKIFSMGEIESVPYEGYAEIEEEDIQLNLENNTVEIF